MDHCWNHSIVPRSVTELRSHSNDLMWQFTFRVTETLQPWDSNWLELNADWSLSETTLLPPTIAAITSIQSCPWIDCWIGKINPRVESLAVRWRIFEWFRDISGTLFDFEFIN
jgi:hypothetical protein